MNRTWAIMVGALLVATTAYAGPRTATAGRRAAGYCTDSSRCANPCAAVRAPELVPKRTTNDVRRDIEMRRARTRVCNRHRGGLVVVAVNVEKRKGAVDGIRDGGDRTRTRTEE